MSQEIYEFDTRDKKDEYITKYFDSHDIKYIRNKLYSGDVKLLNSTRVIVDLKANVEEIAHNICNSKEHARILQEIKRAKEIKCEQFIFLIKDDKIKTSNDLNNWVSDRTKVKGSTLYKAMCTMSKRYGCKFIFTTKENAPIKLLELFGDKNV